MIRFVPARLAVDPIAEHGEGPVWDQRTDTLHWVDMLAGDLLSLGVGGGVRRRHVASVLAAVRPRRAGGLVAAVERGFAVIPEQPDEPPLVMEVWSDAAVRMNEGTCDPAGRFYAGSMAYDSTPGVGSVWRLGPDLSPLRVLDNVTVSNGMAFTPDGAYCYYVDSATSRVDVFDVEQGTGALVRRRPFVVISADDGVPDGITLDSEGAVWVALWGGGAVHRYDRNGRLDVVVPVPVSLVTACAFGGPGLDQLYVTTSRLGLNPASGGDAGGIFVAVPDHVGTPTMPFTG